MMEGRKEGRTTTLHGREEGRGKEREREREKEREREVHFAFKLST
jgi:hypothetical protein